MMMIHDEEDIAIILSGLLYHPSYLPNKPCNLAIAEKNVPMTQMKVL
jgi:hypothetical protein